MGELILSCTVLDCGGKHAAKGLCGKHYNRLHRHGSVHQTALVGRKRCAWCAAPLLGLRRSQASYCGQYCRDALRRDVSPQRQEARRAASLRWIARHPDRARATSIRSRPGVTPCGCITESGIAALRRHWLDSCAYCGAPGTDVEHYVPIALNGPHCLNNFVLACDPCNSAKGARRPSDWSPASGVQPAKLCAAQ